MALYSCIHGIQWHCTAIQRVLETGWRNGLEKWLNYSVILHISKLKFNSFLQTEMILKSQDLHKVRTKLSRLLSQVDIKPIFAVTQMVQNLVFWFTWHVNNLIWFLPSRDRGPPANAQALALPVRIFNCKIFSWDYVFKSPLIGYSGTITSGKNVPEISSVFGWERGFICQGRSSPFWWCESAVQECHCI